VTYAYVVVFSGPVPVQTLKRVLDSAHFPQIEKTFACFPNAIFVATELSATELSKLLKRRVRAIKRLLILDANTDRNGWMPKAGWEFFRDYEPADDDDGTIDVNSSEDDDLYEID